MKKSQRVGPWTVSCHFPGAAATNTANYHGDVRRLSPCWRRHSGRESRRHGPASHHSGSGSSCSAAQSRAGPHRCRPRWTVLGSRTESLCSAAGSYTAAARFRADPEGQRPTTCAFLASRAARTFPKEGHFPEHCWGQREILRFLQILCFGEAAHAVKSVQTLFKISL